MMTSILKASAISLLMYVLISYFHINSILRQDISQYNEIISTIEIYKQKIVSLALLSESEISQPVFANQHLSAKRKIYKKSLHDENLTDKEEIIVALMQLAQHYTPRLFSSKYTFMYYRSYEGKSYLLNRQVEHFPISESLFNQEGCDIHETCSIYANESQLDDRVIVSPVYKDWLTNKYIISISSPVYSFGSNNILGDFVVDFTLPEFFTNTHNFFTSRDKNHKYNIIETSKFNFEKYFYTMETFIDNETKFIYRVSLSSLFKKNIWLFFVFMILFSIIFWKWEESKLHKRKFHAAEKTSSHDELTDLYNRKIFRDNEFTTRVESEGASIIAIDGNRIKKINDTYGHAVGDQAIKLIAEQMKLTFRKTDYLIRCGGDEFIAVLPGCKIQNASNLAEELRYQIATQPFTKKDEMRVTISAGIVVKSEYESIQEAIIRADEILYQDKLHHRHAMDTKNR